MIDRLPKLLPKELRELLAFVPRRGWDAIEWQPLLSRMRSIGWQLASRKGVDRLAAELEPMLPAVALSGSSVGGTPLTELRKKQRKAVGDKVLRLYFTQWKNPHGLFLDLRPSRLVYAGNQLRFRPSGLWSVIDDDFRLGMIDLYRGFYCEDAGLLDDALLRMGLLNSELSAKQADELRGLLKTHFGAETGAQRFSIDQFRVSFDALFDFFLTHDYRLSSDFVLVGFYLITLYLTLDMLGERHDVVGLCLDELGA